VLLNNQNKTHEDEEELKAYANSDVFCKSKLADNYAEFKKRLANFVKTDLRNVRINEANSIINVLMSIVDTTLKNTKEIPQNNTKEYVESKRKEQWNDVWQLHKSSTEKDANSYLYYNVYDSKEELMLQYKNIFENEIDSLFSSMEAQVNSLQKEVSCSDAHMMLIDITPIESSERQRLVEYFLSKISSVISAVGSDLYALLSGYADVLVGKIAPHIAPLWDLQSVITLEDCIHQVDSQVMRVFYPLIHAVLQWPVSHQQRKKRNFRTISSMSGNFS